MTPIELFVARKNLRMSQTELGDYLGVSQNIVSAYERGAHPVPCSIAKRVVRLLEARVVSKRFRQARTLRRLTDVEIRSALVDAGWRVQTAAKNLRVQSGALYMHIRKYLPDEWRNRPAKQRGASPKRQRTTLHPWRTRPARKEAA